MARKKVERVGHGLVALRKRLVLRAEVLTGQTEFVDACRVAQHPWNNEHIRYRVPTQMDDRGVPAALARDYRDELTGFEREESVYGIDDPESSGKDQYEDAIAARGRRARKPALHAFDDWQEAVCELAVCFFPEQNFPVLAEDGAHPASVFLGRAIASAAVEQLRDQAGALIDAQLDVRDALGFDVEPVLALGLYPGVTAKDIEDAAPRIADRVNIMYRERLPLARIRALRSQDLSPQKIGDCLGMTERAVKDALHLMDEEESTLR